MSTATTPETELTPDLIDRVMKLSPESRERLDRELIRSLYPDLDLSRFRTHSELTEYLRTKPDSVVEARG